MFSTITHIIYIFRITLLKNNLEYVKCATSFYTLVSYAKFTGFVVMIQVRKHEHITITRKTEFSETKAP
jgi:hypothetical protein